MKTLRGIRHKSNENQKAIHAQHVTVWCALGSGGIIGPFIFEDEEGNAVTVNGERYHALTI